MATGSSSSASCLPATLRRLVVSSRSAASRSVAPGVSPFCLRIAQHKRTYCTTHCVFQSRRFFASSSKAMESSDSEPLLVDKEKSLFSVRVGFNKPDGEHVELTAVYQDNFPAGSSKGTVVTLHGSPGSHNDFKFVLPYLTMKGIRMIGVNYPAFGYSEDLPGLSYGNEERDAFTQALVDKLQLKDRIIFMGHSRGTENALNMSAQNLDRSVGTVMINPPGLRIHRGIRPFWIITGIGRLYHHVPLLRPILHWILHKVYNFIGLRLRSGRVAAVCIHSMEQIALEDQRPALDIINQNGTKRTLFAYACDDFLIEPEISREFVDEFHDSTTIVCHSSEEEETERVTTEMVEEFRCGRNTVAVEFVPDGHFLQKTRPKFIAEGVVTMFEVTSNEKTNGDRLRDPVSTSELYGDGN